MFAKTLQDTKLKVGLALTKVDHWLNQMTSTSLFQSKYFYDSVINILKHQKKEYFFYLFLEAFAEAFWVGFMPCALNNEEKTWCGEQTL